MRHALGSNRAEYSRRNELGIQIRIATNYLERPQPNLNRMKLDDLRDLWRSLYKEVVDKQMVVRKAVEIQESVNEKHERRLADLADTWTS
jgi:hypothetical protein